jgi:hypothetical protein
MKRYLLVAGLLLFLSVCGCVRTYRMEHSHHSDSQLNLDGTTSNQSHTEAAERAWRGFWPFAPSCIRP